MNDNKTGRRIKLTTAFSIVFLLLTIFYHHIDKYLTGIVFIILWFLIPITFITMVVYAFKGIIQIIQNRKHLTFRFCLPTIIVLVTLAYTIASPYHLDSEKLESKVILRACFEGTQNQAYILFRQDSSFELNWTGVFFADDWFYGKYTQKGDTFYLDYHTQQPYRFGDTLLHTGKSLITISKINKRDSTIPFVPFYIGYCKGLN